MDFDDICKNKIEKLMSLQITKFAIYPYGIEGKRLKQILKEVYGKDSIAFDQSAGAGVLLPEYVTEYRNHIFLIAAKRKYIRDEIIHYLLNCSIDDTHIVNLFGDSDLFLDDRIDRNVSEEEIRWVNNYRRQYSDNREEERVIVSLTSYPPRIKHILPTIRSLLTQKRKPYKVILWLALEEFIHKREDLPQELVALESDNFEIKWCHNLLSYKKLIPALQEYPTDIIVTADDDIIYSDNWLSVLYETHCKYPEDIICHRVTKIVKDDKDRWATIPGGWNYYNEGCYLNKLCGGGGTLYPVKALYGEICSKEIFMRLAPSSDDIWFWLMAVMNGTRVRAAKNNIVNLNFNCLQRDTPMLCSINDSGDKLFWLHFYNILQVYPELVDKLENEYAVRKGFV